MLPREPSWKEEERGGRGSPREQRHPVRGKLIISSRTADTRFESLGIQEGEKSFSKLLTLMLQLFESKITATFAYAALYTTHFDQGKQYSKRRDDNLDFQSRTSSSFL